MENKKNTILKETECFSFFQVEVISDIEIDGEIYKDIKQRNNKSIIKLENWYLKKETFFNQRMDSYSDELNLLEKINLEFDKTSKLFIPINDDYKIICDRYLKLLEQQKEMHSEKQQVETIKEQEHPFSSNDRFNPLFKDQRSYDLFLFLVNRYAIKKNASQFSQIYRWMNETDGMIKNRSGEKYKSFVRDKFSLPEKFLSKIDEIKKYERPTLNDHLKEFNSLKKD